MELEELKQYLLDKKGSAEDFPFGPEALVCKVMGKMFALVAWDETPLRVSLKCDPVRALELRMEFEDIQGAYHMNKKHWSMVNLGGSVPTELVLEMIDDSYDLVVKSMSKADRMELQNQ